MREIKFRLWSKNTKSMVSWEQLLQHARNFTSFDNLISHFNNPKAGVLMQYTGLKDKNGKEIYEGDIVGEESVYHFLDRGWKPSKGAWKIIGEKTNNFTGKNEERFIAGYALLVVEWSQTTGFEPFCDSKENCWHCGGGRKSTDFEVIGNIYENPELLKEEALDK